MSGIGNPTPVNDKLKWELVKVQFDETITLFDGRNDTLVAIKLQLGPNDRRLDVLVDGQHVESLKDGNPSIIVEGKKIQVLNRNRELQSLIYLGPLGRN